MAEYIEREALRDSVESIDWYSVYRGKLTTGANSENALYKANDIYSAIDNAPAADVAPVVHGRIVGSLEDGRYRRRFSCCGEDATMITQWTWPKYCFSCGAKMDGGTE